MQAAEQWRTIPGYEGRYEVSDQGRVRSVDSTITDSLGRKRFCRGRVLAFTIGPKGYVSGQLGRNGTRYAHRLVLEAFVGPCPDGMEACHNDGVRHHNTPSNLRWDTRSENHRDTVRHGTHPESRKTVCPRGHKLEHPNLIPGEAAKGHRACLACNRALGFAKYRGVEMTRELADRYYRDGAPRKSSSKYKVSQ